jgi:hypothetical protein
MAPISLPIPVLTVLTPPISALPNITVIPIREGTCSGFPSSHDTTGRNADAFVFRPPSVDNAAINNFPTYIASNTLVVSLTNITDPSIFCCDHGATVLSMASDTLPS